MPARTASKTKDSAATRGGGTAGSRTPSAGKTSKASGNGSNGGGTKLVIVESPS